MILFQDGLLNVYPWDGFDLSKYSSALEVSNIECISINAISWSRNQDASIVHFVRKMGIRRVNLHYWANSAYLY